jgi:hypothetical protein
VCPWPAGPTGSEPALSLSANQLVKWYILRMGLGHDTKAQGSCSILCANAQLLRARVLIESVARVGAGCAASQDVAVHQAAACARA